MQIFHAADFDSGDFNSGWQADDCGDVICNAGAGGGVEDTRHLPAAVEAGPLDFVRFRREVSFQWQMYSAAPTFKACVFHGRFLASRFRRFNPIFKGKGRATADCTTLDAKSGAALPIIVLALLTLTARSAD